MYTMCMRGEWLVWRCGVKKQEEEREKKSVTEILFFFFFLGLSVQS